MSHSHSRARQQEAPNAHYVTLHTQTILLCHKCLRAIALTSSPASPKESQEIYQRFLRLTFCGVCRTDEHTQYTSRKHRPDTETADPGCKERTHDGLVIAFPHRLQNAVQRITDVLGIREQDICIVGGRSGVVVMCVERCMEGVGDGATARLVLAAAGAGVAGTESEVRRFWKVPAGKGERERSGRRKESARKEGSPYEYDEDQYEFEYVYGDKYDFWAGTRAQYGTDGTGAGYGKTEYFYE